MRILITGGTGLVGKELGKALFDLGHELVILTRSINQAKTTLPFPAKLIAYQKNHIPEEALTDVDAVINLAGENIGEKRWTQKRKLDLYNSRIDMTRALTDAIKQQIAHQRNKVRTIISASAIGIYGNQKDTLLTESSPVTDDFLAKICQDWEKESQILAQDNIQVINPRIGIVLSKQGGALDRLLPLFTSGMGSAVGSGQQWMSWIHIDDLVSLFIYLLESNFNGPVNAVAPHPVTNLAFSQTLAQALNKPLFPRVPAVMLKLLLGEMSTLVLSSQRVQPEKIISSDFKFKYPKLSDALEEITESLKDGHEEFVTEQWIPKKPEEVFDFFCDSKNLEKITPEFLKFRVTGQSTKNIEQDTLIDYRLSLHGIPFKWKTKIDEWAPPHRFVDTQLSGPYSLWKHTHELLPMGEGTLLRDRVLYKVPLGQLGKLTALHKVKKDVAKIFKYRREYISREFYH